MYAEFRPGRAAGAVEAPPSKSMGHRMLLCAGLSGGPCTVRGIASSQDMLATLDCLSALGVRWEQTGDAVTLSGGDVFSTPKEVVDCRESGSTLRFFVPLLLLGREKAALTGHGRLMERPMEVYAGLCRERSLLFRQEGDRLWLRGPLQPGLFQLAGDVSSQFITGLLFALPLLEGKSTLTPTGRLESAGYLALTRQAQALFGLSWSGERAGEIWQPVSGCGYRSPGRAEVEGDWSCAAFWLAADALSSGEIRITGLDPESAQGDRAAAELIPRIRKGGAVIDAGNIPDLVPPLAAVAAASPGESRFVNAGRLRLKESDRLQSVCAMLKSLGAEAEEKPEELIIRGKETLRGGVVDSFRDHRIAMSAAVAALACREPVTILGAEAVEKSYPAFWQDYRRLGGRIREEEA